MLDPFAKLAEAGFSQQGGLITAGPVTEHWTPELIASLDWMHVAELVRAIAAHFLSSSLRSAFRHQTVAPCINSGGPPMGVSEMPPEQGGHSQSWW